MLSGGGKRREARDIVRGADLATKFLKDVRTIRRKDDKSETEAICRHSERQRRNPAYYNISNSKGIYMKDFSETDHASMTFGILASKLVSCRHSNADLLVFQCSKGEQKK